MPYADIEARRAYQRERRQTHKDQKRRDAVFYDKARHANQRARLYGADGTIDTADVRQILAVGTCHYCGSTDRLTIDHVIPLHLKGPNRFGNIVACCLSCNISKKRADRPGRWSHRHDTCIKCGRDDRPHQANGYCVACHSSVGVRVNEKQFTHQVIEAARYLGWLCYHTFDSRRSEPGFPDIVATHEQHGTIYAELKTHRGKVSDAQRVWLNRLRGAGEHVFLWRPQDWDEVEAVLKGDPEAITTRVDRW